MGDYMRKIIYLRKREGGVQSSQAGFVRLEMWPNRWRLHLTMPEEHPFGGLPIYAVYEREQKLYPMLLGKVPYGREWDFEQAFSTRKMEWYVKDILGFFIGRQDCYLVGECPDYKGRIEYGSIVFARRREEEKRQQDVTSAVMTGAIGTITIDAMGAVDETAEAGNETNADAETAASAAEIPRGTGPSLDSLPEMYPFEDDELEWCRQMEPQDLFKLPMDYWHYAKNTFLMQGFYNYRHLLYAYKEGSYYLGVPGQFHRREQFLAGEFGFDRFKGTKKKRVTMGDYGYWMKRL